MFRTAGFLLWDILKQSSVPTHYHWQHKHACLWRRSHNSSPACIDVKLNIGSTLDQPCVNTDGYCAISIVLRRVVMFWSSMYRVILLNKNCVNITSKKSTIRKGIRNFEVELYKLKIIVGMGMKIGMYWNGNWNLKIGIKPRSELHGLVLKKGKGAGL